MLIRNRNISTSRIQNGIYLNTTLILLTGFTLIISVIDNLLNIGFTKFSNPFLITIIFSIIAVQTLIWMIRNKGYRGIKYSFIHYSTVMNLRKAFLDSKYYNIRFHLNKKIAQLPKIKIDFEKGLSIGKLYIENIQLDKDLSSSNISFALNKYVVERSYLSRDEKYFIFEIYDSNINRQLTFENLKEFQEYSSKTKEQHLFIDKFTDIPMHSSLIAGQSGSGKTYALYTLVLQMLLKKDLYNLYFADPKNSSLAVIGEEIASNNTASNFDEIIHLLKTFNELMDNRKAYMKDKLNSRLEATYVHFGYSAHVLMFGEFASFQTILQSMEKKKRDEVMKLISQVVLQGRQLEFFIWFVMQKSDSNLLPTYIRENLAFKFFIGNSEKQTYITAFGPGINIKEKGFQLGEGLFTCPIIANNPKICHFSYLDFDIFEAIRKLR
ncbi:FtsK/SpoIIIE domain-containing protein [Salinicoccus sesuvii]|uniref:FtsK/SpoIIIE domain-containing protein n=1 Tax=Salinicoccus sesuvii TaxID=868281 RepID=A0ABV7N3K8_9STAP